MRSSLLSIGEASKLKNVSIKALRYYEKIGIFKPAYIDPQSGYRYYSPAQLFDLDVILPSTTFAAFMGQFTSTIHFLQPLHFSTSY